MSVFSNAMREALRLTRAGDLRDATRVIRHALQRRPADTAARDAAFDTVAEGRWIDSEPASPLPPATPQPPYRPDTDAQAGVAAATSPRPELRGHFTAGVFSNAAGTRAYKLWVPSAAAQAERLPLVVMLHGCTQDADDFARGTRMNEYGERHACFVLYPIQDGAANAQRCWRWFDTAHQGRDSGEPSILAGMARHLVSEQRIDPDRIYVGGLSAGAAMALVLGDSYPDVFAAVAVHSGLPLGAARDVPSAFAAMAGRASAHSASAGIRPISHPMPALVIHGSADQTVRSSNGDAVVQQLMQGYENAGHALQRQVVAEPAHTRSCFYSGDGRLVIEQWTVKNAGHAWSGGAAGGSYTAPAGPDASARMLAFFLGHSLSDRRAG